ncbi:MAG: type II toxin-antitoxin system VapC family toxin [Chloroflexota bacterium]|nr:type II toxin-antitoxin system VapC family toxin [Chloroflexota bacterium]
MTRDSTRLAEPPRAVVVDASVAVEFLDGNPAWVTQWEAWVADGTILLAPQIFPLEVANALLRGKQFSAADAQNRLTRLLDSGLEPSDRGMRGLFESIQLAEKHRLTVYDAAYLQIALEVEADVATTDVALANAAAREGLAVV